MNKLKVGLLVCLVVAAAAEAASGSSGSTSYFQPLWNVVTAVLGDTFIGYIGAGAGLGVAGQRWWENMPSMQVIKPLVIGAGLGSFTGLAQALSGAMV